MIRPTEEQIADAAERLRGIEGPTFYGLGGKRHINEREYADAVTLAMAYLAVHPDDGMPLIWSDDQVFRLNASQHRHDTHPYTCGNDSRHRPLVATRQGWRCADCEYRQGWAHGIPRTGAEGGA